ncbi:fibronectin type III domain-containing protein [Helicobacter winghamensis]|uniref:Fibronectin type-III domain-containing protein n=1 Tax=Helicobacter winghamensis TaxID=157268 RepID=A0A2N3PKF5_9HELI|nr:fibronectin type III domain-containing protein [Helicobacter winghamensis]EEO25957.1 fibronectin type III domain protein [Helicobacter winghamensis ATCC BAA-430]PKT76970.1 hypothetical protein BCM34_07280 [Helicobacter winghamensis]PKT77110.1 hypothetical protein BCM35_03365 [Helicobacter winghamensis]PKT77671.1 hypothetical protein BCM32_05640 [Helicobacter winghamensis]PKT81909.1 hypothetical protein BCM31_01635 [Helicobacter winghamensis]
MQKIFPLNILGGILSLFFFLFSGCSSAVFNTKTTINSNINPPSDIRVLSDVNTIAFEWKLVQDPSVMGYYIYRKETNEQDFKKIATLESRFNTHYADNDLKAGTQYIYYFTTFDKDRNVSSYSPAVSATTLSISAITYVEAISNYPRKVKVLWNPHQDPRVVGYIIQRKDKNGAWKEVGNVKSRLLVEFLDTKLEDGTTYTYQVLAYNAKNSLSIPSSIVSATTKPKPTPITNLRATLNEPKKITLNWDLHPNQEVTSYKILRSGFISSIFSTIATIPSNTNTYQDIIKKDGERYQYKIVATDKDGIDSLESEPITGATLAIPNAPSITYARIENGSVVLKWVPTDDRAKEYIVYKKDSVFFGETLRYNQVLTPEFIDKEVKAGEKYYYRISAVDENGLESKPSEEVTLSLPK